MLCLNVFFLLLIHSPTYHCTFLLKSIIISYSSMILLRKGYIWRKLIGPRISNKGHFTPESIPKIRQILLEFRPWEIVNFTWHESNLIPSVLCIPTVYQGNISIKLTTIQCENPRHSHRTIIYIVQISLELRGIPLKVGYLQTFSVMRGLLPTRNTEKRVFSKFREKCGRASRTFYSWIARSRTKVKCSCQLS